VAVPQKKKCELKYVIHTEQKEGRAIFDSAFFIEVLVESG
jgi:hypothetical protein